MWGGGMNGHDKLVVDAGSAVLAAGAVLKWLPPLAAAISIIWFGVRLYEHFRWVYRGRSPEEKP